MAVTLTCDAPSCAKSIAAAVSLNRPAAPPGWVMMARREGDLSRMLVGCCADHLLRAIESVPVMEAAGGVL